MGKRFSSIEDAHRDFIARQHIFFNASAAEQGRVNISPKDAASLRILGANQALYLDQTGSGNETAAHLRRQDRLTLMFCAFEGAPVILRLYGLGRIVPRDSAEYRELLASAYDGVEPPGARQMVLLDVDLVQTSCGYGVPFFDYVGERDTLRRWATAKGEEQLQEYRREKNTVSIDGFSTGIAK